MKTTDERFAWALRVCEQSHIRPTAVRAATLACLAGRRVPANLDFLAQAIGANDRCNRTTVYRTLMIFKDAGLVRDVGRWRKSSHFVLNVPGDSGHFLICERCGSVQELDLPADVEAAMQRLTRENGFAVTRQCVDIQGLCQVCEQKSRGDAGISKVMSRRSLAQV